MQFTPLKIGGVACWILAIMSTFFLPIYYLLFLAAAVIVAWIIPGYLLRKKYNQQNN
jgi:cobalamin biosynthesis protein CobD/CbiB